MRSKRFIRNARFWEWNGDGFVKITLKPSQVLEHYWSARTDEGWRRVWRQWEHTGSHVRYTVQDGSRDCDGRLDHHQVHECRLGDLKANNQLEMLLDRHLWWKSIPSAAEVDEVRGVCTPAWQRVSASQRDYEAEKAGY